MLTREGFGLVGGWFVGRERKRSDVGSESEIRGGFRRMDSEDVQEEGREDAVWFKKDEEEKKKRRSTRRGSGRRISEGSRLPRGEHHKTQLFSMDIAWIMVMG